MGIEEFKWAFGRCFYPLMRGLITLAGTVVLLSGALLAVTTAVM